MPHRHHQWTFVDSKGEFGAEMGAALARRAAQTLIEAHELGHRRRRRSRGGRGGRVAHDALGMRCAARGAAARAVVDELVARAAARRATRRSSLEQLLRAREDGGCEGILRVGCARLGARLGAHHGAHLAAWRHVCEERRQQPLQAASCHRQVERRVEQRKARLARPVACRREAANQVRTLRLGVDGDGEKPRVAQPREITHGGRLARASRPFEEHDTTRLGC